MKVTFEDLLSRKEWLHGELLNSLTVDVINQANDDKFYDVKLLVNGIELEPQFFNDIMNNVVKYIEKEAKSLVREQLEVAEQKARKLSELIDEASNQIKGEFDLFENEDYY